MVVVKLCNFWQKIAYIRYLLYKEQLYLMTGYKLLKNHRTFNNLYFKMYFFVAITVAVNKCMQIKIFAKQVSVHEFGFNPFMRVSIMNVHNLWNIFMS